MRIGDWSADVCSSDLARVNSVRSRAIMRRKPMATTSPPSKNPTNANSKPIIPGESSSTIIYPYKPNLIGVTSSAPCTAVRQHTDGTSRRHTPGISTIVEPQHDKSGRVMACALCGVANGDALNIVPPMRSEEHTSELQSLMRTSYAVFCLKNKKL